MRPGKARDPKENRKTRVLGQDRSGRRPGHLFATGFCRVSAKNNRRSPQTQGSLAFLVDLGCRLTKQSAVLAESDATPRALHSSPQSFCRSATCPSPDTSRKPKLQKIKVAPALTHGHPANTSMKKPQEDCCRKACSGALLTQRYAGGKPLRTPTLPQNLR